MNEITNLQYFQEYESLHKYVWWDTEIPFSNSIKTKCRIWKVKQKFAASVWASAVCFHAEIQMSKRWY